MRHRFYFSHLLRQGTSYCWPIYKKRRIANTALVSTFACNLTFPDWRWQPISVPHGSQDNWLNWMVNNLKRKFCKTNEWKAHESIEKFELTSHSGRKYKWFCWHGPPEGVSSLNDDLVTGIGFQISAIFKTRCLKLSNLLFLFKISSVVLWLVCVYIDKTLPE